MPGQGWGTRNGWGLLEKWGEEPESWALSAESPFGSTVSVLGLSKGRRKCRHPTPPQPGLWTTVRWLKLLGYPASLLPQPSSFQCPVPAHTDLGTSEYQGPFALGVCLFLDFFLASDHPLCHQNYAFGPFPRVLAWWLLSR